MTRLVTKYHFVTDEFGVSDVGIHLLRSRFNYQTIKFSEIKIMSVGKGMELHNWALIFVVGAILIVVGVGISIGIINTLLTHGASGPRILLVLFIPFVGAYFVFNSVQIDTIMTINYGCNNKHKFPLKKILIDKKLNAFNALMREKLGNRFKVME